MQGMKLELFIFDTFPLAERVALLEVHRHEEFAPVKNAPGSASDSPDTARQAILKLHTKYDPSLNTLQADAVAFAVLSLVFACAVSYWHLRRERCTDAELLLFLLLSAAGLSL